MIAMERGDLMQSHWTVILLYSALIDLLYHLSSFWIVVLPPCVVFDCG